MSSKELRAATIRNDITAVRALIEGGGTVPVNAIDERGWTALHYAVWFKHADLICYLVQAAGAIATIEDHNGLSAWHSACRSCALDVVRCFAPSTKIPTPTNDREQTAVHWASAFNTLDVVRYLVEECGGNVAAKNHKDETPLDVARYRGKRDSVVEYLTHQLQSKGYLIEPPPPPPSSDQLFHAIAENDVTRVQTLIHQGVDVHAPQDWVTPLYAAARDNRVAIVDCLLQSDRIHVDAVTEKGFTALHVVCQNGHLPIVQLLLEPLVHSTRRETEGNATRHGSRRKGNATRRANVQASDGNSWTALHYASRFGHVDIVAYLLTRHADMDATTRPDVTTPLHLASREGHGNIVECLVQNGANKQAKNSKGEIALDLARQNGRGTVVSFLHRPDETRVRPLKRRPSEVVSWFLVQQERDHENQIAILTQTVAQQQGEIERQRDTIKRLREGN